jgi:hypothetical protein
MFTLGCAGSSVSNTPAVVAAFIQCLNDPDPGVASSAAAILGNWKLEPLIAVASLAAGLEDSRPDVRHSCARALGAFGTNAQSAMPKLNDHLSDDDPTMRIEVENALRQIRGEGSPLE